MGSREVGTSTRVWLSGRSAGWVEREQRGVQLGKQQGPDPEGLVSLAKRPGLRGPWETYGEFKARRDCVLCQLYGE